MIKKICIIYTHHKLGDLIWQLPYIKAISNHHKCIVDLILRKTTQGKNILNDLSHIKNIHYNDFRKGFYYWVDVIKLINIYKQNNYTHIYILDKVNKPAIAAKFCSIKNIIGPGIGNQKKWLTTKNFLDDQDWKLSYTEQSQKLLKINQIKVNDLYPKIEINIKKFNEKNSDLLRNGKKITFGIDSFEDYKMWYEDNFIELADHLYSKKLFDYIYLICAPNRSHIAKNIIKNSNKNYFIDCSHKDLTGVITAIKNSYIFIGNNSGPLNLASALSIKSFGLIVNDPISELRFSNINFITPDNYKDNIWIRDRVNMKSLSSKKVFDIIIKNLNDNKSTQS